MLFFNDVWRLGVLSGFLYFPATAAAAAAAGRGTADRVIGETSLISHSGETQ